MEVELFAGLRDSAGGAKIVNVEGSTIAELLTNLAKKYPAMSERIDQGIACLLYTSDAADERVRV